MKQVKLISTARTARFRDITGFRSGYLEALSYAGTDGRRAIWDVKCHGCQASGHMQATELLKAREKSCGCQRGRLIAEKRRTHQMSLHPAYAVWRSMLARCHNPKHKAWHNYGGRGITVCTAWHSSFETFWADCGSGWKKGLDLDRTDNEKGYSPDNVRWVTRQRNSRNTRLNVTINTPKGPMLLCEAAEISGIGLTTLSYRHANGWPAARMFDTPDPRNRLSIF